MLIILDGRGPKAIKRRVIDSDELIKSLSETSHLVLQCTFSGLLCPVETFKVNAKNKHLLLIKLVMVKFDVNFFNSTNIHHVLAFHAIRTLI